jgi:cation diffusion facilitator CzcD-associated flavoprotein CzcO
MPHAEKAEMEVPDDPQCLPGRIKIIHVGMGASGLLAAHKAKKLLQNYELICYEKNETIGGTWLENRYPGCACDIPAHSTGLQCEYKMLHRHRLRLWYSD